MLADDIKRLRTALDCSVGELAEAAGVDVRTVLDWESGERFPTKRHADKLEALRGAAPGAIRRKLRGKKPPTGFALLADSRLWAIVRKLVAHADMMTEVERIATKYDDPAD